MTDAIIPILLLLSLPAVVVLLWLIGAYNGLVRARNHVREAWSGIDTELKRRHDLIPNLVATVKGYAAHEASVFEAVASARAAAAGLGTATPQQRSDAERALTGAVRTLLAVTEAYPQLRASQHFLALQHQLAETEDRIQAIRRFYNANVRDLNNRVESFPTNLVANTFGFSTVGFFEIESAMERQAPVVSMGR